MSTVRDLPATETRVVVNARMDLATARAFLRMLCEKVLADEPVDLITFSMNGTLK